MAVPVTYRYKWRGVNLTSLLNQTNPTSVITVSDPAPIPIVDVTSDKGDPDKIDIDQAMDLQGWSFESVAPPDPPKGIVLRQFLEKRLDTDQSTNSNVFIDLISLPITTTIGGVLKVSASISSLATGIGTFRLTLDGIAISDGGAGHEVLGGNAILKRIAVNPGLHVVGLQYKSDLLGTVFVRPITTENEHATLWVEELSG